MAGNKKDENNSDGANPAKVNEEAVAALAELNKDPEVAKQIAELPDDIDELRVLFVESAKKLQNSVLHADELEKQLREALSKADRADAAEKKLKSLITSNSSDLKTISNMHSESVVAQAIKFSPRPGPSPVLLIITHPETGNITTHDFPYADISEDSVGGCRLNVMNRN